MLIYIFFIMLITKKILFNYINEKVVWRSIISYKFIIYELKILKKI